jgi:ZIP family zinc transporter
VSAALLWGSVAAVSLVLGAVLGVARQWHDGLIGVVLGFGAGALISSISFELTAEGFQLGGAMPLALGIAAGALAFFFADRGVRRLGKRIGGAAGLPLALGALLDGIPEQVVLGIGLAQGEGVSVALLAAIFVSNLPEAIGSSTDMKIGGIRPRVIIFCGLRWRRCAQCRRLEGTPCLGSPQNDSREPWTVSPQERCWSCLSDR